MSNKLGIPTPQSIETPITETSQLSQILSGWGNRIKDTFGILDEETKLMSEKDYYTVTYVTWELVIHVILGKNER